MESEQAKLVTEKVKVFEASKALKAALAVISQKEGDLNATRMALAVAQAKALADVVSSRVTAEAKVAAVYVETQAEVEKAVEDGFGAGFFQGYTDLKMRVALVHLE